MNIPCNTHEVFALRVGHNSQRLARENFFFDACCGPPDSPMPLDYFFWVIRSATGVIVVDTGFSPATASRRNRQMVRTPAQALAVLDIDPRSVRDVVITHLHWDHAGGTDIFPNARIHLQEDELRFCTGPAMRHATLRKIYEVEDIVESVRLLHGERLVLHRGSVLMVPGVWLHQVGGHTPGSQAVQVATARGNLVLASDSAHLWANLRGRRPFPILHDLARALDAFETLESLSDGPDHVIPGHDPEVARRFPRWRGDEHIFCLHEMPAGDRAPI
ncbi:MAG: hypothetical protein RL522_64 [Pseudomonadota bacterium]|jgi:glyoxylase-like metal-dependent hydrolase (beta-lactamase superfamily II)